MEEKAFECFNLEQTVREIAAALRVSAAQVQACLLYTSPSPRD